MLVPGDNKGVLDELLSDGRVFGVGTTIPTSGKYVVAQKRSAELGEAWEGAGILYQDGKGIFATGAADRKGREPSSTAASVCKELASSLHMCWKHLCCDRR